MCKIFVSVTTICYPQKCILKIWYLFQNAPFTTQINKRAASTLRKAVCLLYQARPWEHDEGRASYLAGAISPTQQEICREGRFASFQVSAIYSSHNVPEIWDNPYWFYSFYSAWKTIFLIYEQLNYVTFIRKL